ncbi:MAG: hypothetical protein EAZ85_09010 [Bacteroidetes bacterium]|nr:MAG: hypothetical protein EAZ85_09010 [Bacteroidota bacterium]TAG88056.1 MAG: hypothetical protein EAZ20_09345 [Bacteroidota bacterium]
MKKIAVLLSVFIFSFVFLYAQNKPISLQQAIKDKKIEAKFSGMPNGTHYLKPILIQVKNLQNVGETILIEAGTFFVSNPAQYQDITVLENTMIALNASEQKSQGISGACSEAQLSAPNDKVQYQIAPAPKPEYIKYAKFIDENKYFGTYEAQKGMWCVSNDQDWLIDSGGENAKMGRKITYFLAKLRKLEVFWLTPEGELIEIEKEFKVLENGKPVLKKHKIQERNPQPPFTIFAEKSFDVVSNGKRTKIIHYCTREKPEPDSIIIDEKEFEMVEKGQRIKKKHFVTKEAPKPFGEIVYGQKDYKVKKNGKVYSTYVRLITNQAAEPMCEMWGNGRVSIQKTCHLRVGMFDVNGILIREIYNNPAEKIGTHTLEYAYDCDVYTDKEYHFKIIKDNIVTLTAVLKK